MAQVQALKLPMSTLCKASMKITSVVPGQNDYLKILSLPKNQHNA